MSAVCFLRAPHPTLLRSPREVAYAVDIGQPHLQGGAARVWPRPWAENSALQAPETAPTEPKWSPRCDSLASLALVLVAHLAHTGQQSESPSLLEPLRAGPACCQAPQFSPAVSPRQLQQHRLRPAGPACPRCRSLYPHHPALGRGQDPFQKESGSERRRAGLRHQLLLPGPRTHCPSSPAPSRDRVTLFPGETKTTREHNSPGTFSRQQHSFTAMTITFH